MATMRMSVTHALSEAEALKRIKSLLKETKAAHGDLIDDLKEKWTGNTGAFSFTAKGYALSGTITVTAPEIVLEGEMPWALSFIKGKVESLIKARAKELLK